MLYTNLKHLESATEYAQVLAENKYVLIVCGRMDPASITAYRIAEELEQEFAHLKIYDMESDNPESQVIKGLPELNGITNIPYAVFYKNAKVLQTQSKIYSKAQFADFLNSEFDLQTNDDSTKLLQN